MAQKENLKTTTHEYRGVKGRQHSVPGITQVGPRLAHQQQRSLQHIDHAGLRIEVELPHEGDKTLHSFHRLQSHAVSCRLAIERAETRHKLVQILRSPDGVANFIYLTQ